jgi:hypothetical protein
MSYLVAEAPKVNLFDAVMAAREARAEVVKAAVGKTAVWKIRVFGPAKFTERSGVIAYIIGNSAFTSEGHELRLMDMVDSPAAVVGGGSWSLASVEA